MKKLSALVFISLLTISSRAGELVSSFKEACALAEAQSKERSEQAYIHLDLTPYYEKKYSPVYQSCLKSTEHADTSSFSFVAAIGKDGRVLRLYVDHETNIFACVRETLRQDEFPHPPVAPHYFHVTMSFGN
jgi:hypothetical protein